LVGFSTTLRSRTSWLDVAITSLVSAALIGGVLALVTHAFVSRVRRRSSTVALLLVAAVALVTFTAGGVYVGTSQLPHGSWEPLAPPPEPLEDLGGPACYYNAHATLYARARTGHPYQLSEGADSGLPWQPSASIPTEPSDPFHVCHHRETPQPQWSPWPPGSVTASHWVRLESTDCGGAARYVLLHDGSVWRWTTYSCVMGEAAALWLFLAIVGMSSLGIALLVALLPPPFGWPRPA